MADAHTKSGVDISRRGFLKGVGAGTAAAGLLTDAPGKEAAAQEAADASGLRGPGEFEITLSVNGEARTLRVEPRTTLLDALRDRLDLTGSKRVCDRGTCGACTVLLEGEPVYSCSMLAVEAEDRELTTIEGLGSPEALTPVQQAFIEHDAQQCGFCTPGFVVACTAYLEKHPDPSLEEVRDALGGNLCRCGTYAGISEAMMQAARQLRGGA